MKSTNEQNLAQKEQKLAIQNVNRFGKLIAKHKKIAVIRAIEVIVAGA